MLTFDHSLVWWEILTPQFKPDPLPGCHIIERYLNPCRTVVLNWVGRSQKACYFPTVLENNLYISRGRCRGNNLFQ